MGNSDNGTTYTYTANVHVYTYVYITTYTYTEKPCTNHSRRGGGAQASHVGIQYRGTSLTRKRPILAPYNRFMSRALWWVAASYERGTPVCAKLPNKLLPGRRPINSRIEKRVL